MCLEALPRFASITPEAWTRIYWTMVWVHRNARADRAATNTIVQWPWGETHAPITCALFADVINRAVEDQRNGIAIKPILEVAVE
jgi:hypothetical protein